MQQWHMVGEDHVRAWQEQAVGGLMVVVCRRMLTWQEKLVGGNGIDGDPGVVVGTEELEMDGMTAMTADSARAKSRSITGSGTCF